MPEKTPRVGSRILVYRGKARETPGGLQKKDLIRNKHGRIVSRKKQILARKQKHLGSNLAKKGSKVFGPNRSSSNKKSKRRTTKKNKTKRKGRR